MQLTEKTIKEIAEFLDMQFACYIHQQTGEVVALPKNSGDDYFSEEENPWKELIDKVEDNTDQYRYIEELPARESFRIMEDFVETVDDRVIQTRLLQAIEGHKPFANFKHQVHNNAGSYREKWFAFKEGEIIEWVRHQLDVNNDNSS